MLTDALGDRVGYMHKLRIRLVGKIGAREMRRGSDPRRTVVDRAGLRLGERNEFAQRVHA